MQNHWTKDDVAAAWQRFERTYAHDPVAYRFLCGHCIQDETDEDALDYNIIGVWLVCHRKYRDWSTEKNPMIWHGYWNLCRRITGRFHGTSKEQKSFTGKR